MQSIYLFRNVEILICICNTLHRKEFLFFYSKLLRLVYMLKHHYLPQQNVLVNSVAGIGTGRINPSSIYNVFVM